MIKRRSADQKLTELLERVGAVRDNPQYLYQVSMLVVFGSYLTDKELLGDIFSGSFSFGSNLNPISSWRYLRITPVTQASVTSKTWLIFYIGPRTRCYCF